MKKYHTNYYTTTDVGKMFGLSRFQIGNFIRESGILTTTGQKRYRFSETDIIALKKWLANKLIQQYHLEDVVTIKN